MLKINILGHFYLSPATMTKKEKNQSDYDEDYLMHVNTKQLIKNQ